MAFLGGLGTITGPLLGAAVLESLQQYLTQTFSSSATYLIVYGVLFLVVILVLPARGGPGHRRAGSSAGGPGRRRAGVRSPASARASVTGGVAGAAR